MSNGHLVLALGPASPPQSALEWLFFGMCFAGVFIWWKWDAIVGRRKGPPQDKDADSAP